jgi:hypothetical protein
MILTICLITKGRYTYLEKALKSYECFLDTGFVNVILIDNGADAKSGKLLRDWADENPSLVKYLKSEENNPTPYHFFWKKIQSFNPEWIVFPGDDDILILEAFHNWRLVLQAQPDITAFATSARVIDKSGKATGSISAPAIIGLSDKIKELSKSLHEPPFFWPGLYFKFDAITTAVPQSRFVFDWWIGLQLILDGKIHNTNNVGVEYRVHENQDSFQAPSRRKYFEGFHMLMEFITSQNFSDHVELMSTDEILDLLNLCFDEKPLYSQTEYSNAILRELTFRFLKLPQTINVNDEIIEKYLLNFGILTKKSDINSFFLDSKLHFTNSKGNTSIKLLDDTCGGLHEASILFNQNLDSKYIISCRHSKQLVGAIKINCDDLERLTVVEIADKILLTINSQLELNGILSFNMTPFEKLLIVRLRQMKFKLPKFVLYNKVKIKKVLGKLH